MITIVEEFPGENEIALSGETRTNFTGKIEIKGRNNKISLLAPQICTNLFIEMNGGGIIQIGENCVFHDQHLRLFAPGHLTIGDQCAFNGHSTVHMHESASISIGKRCLVAGGVTFSTSHVHKIIDLATGERVNPPGDIEIGEHVWLSGDVSIWPGTVVGSDSVVGLGSFLNSKYPGNCVIAGYPARVIREGVNWDF